MKQRFNVMDKRFIAILAALVLIFGGIFFLTRSKTPVSNVQPTNHVIGQGKSGVTLIEYGDYQCPACEEFNNVVTQVRNNFSKQIYFQFRNLPLTQLHPNAFAGARAAEAANLQGKFWQMHDMLYAPANWLVWTNAKDPTPDFENYAKQLGLNATQFQQDYTSQKVNDLVTADLDAFTKTGNPEQTPTFFLDGQVVDSSKVIDSSNQPSLALFSQLIQNEINLKAKH